MNAKDCENIGYLLSKLRNEHDLDSFMFQMFQLDPRIENEYDGFQEVAVKEQATLDEIEARMVAGFGTDWACRRGIEDAYAKVCAEVRAEMERDDED